MPYRSVSGRYLVFRQTNNQPLTIAGIMPLDQFGNNIAANLIPNQSASLLSSYTPKFITQIDDDTKFADCTADKAIFQTATIPFSLNSNTLSNPDSTGTSTNIYGSNTPAVISSALFAGNMSRAVSFLQNLQPGTPVVTLPPFLIFDINPVKQSNINVHGLVLFNRTDDGCIALPNTLPPGASNCANDMNSVVIELYDSSIDYPTLYNLLSGNPPLPSVTVKTQIPIITWNYGSALFGSVPLKYKVFTIDPDSTTAQFQNVNPFNNLNIENFASPAVKSAIVGYSVLTGIVNSGNIGLTKNTTVNGAIDITVPSSSGTTTTNPNNTYGTTTTAATTTTSANTATTSNNSILPTLSPEQIAALLNSGVNLNSLMSGNSQSVTAKGTNMSSRYMTPNSSIVQTGFSGTSNIFSPYLYYNKNMGESESDTTSAGESFDNVGNMSNKFNVDKFYRY